MGVLLGFDYGTHKIGVAVGQSLTGTATALETLGMVRQRPDWERIARLLAEWQPEALVVGHPFEMTDREANNAEGAKRFARQLHGRFNLPVHMADERLTSREAWTRLGNAANKDPTRVDALAAKLILETWLND
ncbi:MAG: Holliday junction resolvase RuvX [Gammaproteobacteria bacterium]|nr:Holliday junction resolvase RuvX [Gammaproteobacteria bacterium]MCB1926075.1 Holliday junction resolvase RuvX [Gammaproteobacteria bacterium]